MTSVSSKTETKTTITIGLSEDEAAALRSFLGLVRPQLGEEVALLNDRGRQVIYDLFDLLDETVPLRAGEKFFIETE